MTLNELYSLVTAPKQKTAPRLRDLMQSESPIIAYGKHDDGEVTVYENGYVVYTESNRMTIFHLKEVYSRGIEYDTCKGDNIVPKRLRAFGASYFHDKDWLFSVVMYGNWRIANNYEKFLRKKIQFHFSSVSEELEYIFPIDDEPLFDEESDKENEEEIKTLIKTRLKKAEDMIVPSQWHVYVSITGYGITETELACQLGISQQAVSKRFKKCEKHIPRIREEILHTKTKKQM